MRDSRRRVHPTGVPPLHHSWPTFARKVPPGGVGRASEITMVQVSGNYTTETVPAESASPNATQLCRRAAKILQSQPLQNISVCPDDPLFYFLLTKQLQFHRSRTHAGLRRALSFKSLLIYYGEVHASIAPYPHGSMRPSQRRSTPHVHGNYRTGRIESELL
jgi:hypothetical protein